MLDSRSRRLSIKGGLNKVDYCCATSSDQAAKVYRAVIQGPEAEPAGYGPSPRLDLEDDDVYKINIGVV